MEIIFADITGITARTSTFIHLG